jgi:hypothetical protein
MNKEYFSVSEITDNDWQKISQDLLFIELLSRIVKDSGYRMIISGGYAVDGGLGFITRPHRDIDIQIFGQNQVNSNLLKQFIADLKDIDPKYSGLNVKDKGRQEYYYEFFIDGNGISADIYYVQVVDDPFAKYKYVVKKDGSVTNRQEYDTSTMKLEGKIFEAVSPTPELVDKLYKRQIRGDKPKSVHDQDIRNLKLITDPAEVDRQLAKLHG